MRSKRLPLFSAAIGLGIAITASPLAEASPRFTVVNKADSKAKVFIFSGGDTACEFAEKTKTVSSGETDTFGCTGNGKGKCKVSVKVSKQDACEALANTCNEWMVKVEGGSTLTITGRDGNYSCRLD